MFGKGSLVVVTGAAVVGLSLMASAQTPALEWQVNGDAQVVEGSDGTALRMRTGGAVLSGVQMENGTISFVLKAPRERGFVGVQFRRVEGQGQENFYLRPHKHMAPDAVQYQASFGQGDNSWQLFHGPGGTAPAPTQEPEIGVPVDMVFEGRRAALYVGDSDEPVLVVPRTVLESRPGAIVFYSSVLQPTEDPLPIHFEDIRIRETIDRPIPEAPLPTSAPGTIERWGVGAPFRTSELLNRARVSRAARAVEAEPGGTVLFDRHLPRPQGEGFVAVTAGVDIESPSEQNVPLTLGYSDIATVELNGRLLYRGDLQYEYELPQRQGFLVPEQNVVYLPLNAGRNELRVTVAERFGGWAIHGRLGDDGLRVTPMR